MTSDESADVVGDRVVGYVPGAWDMFHIGHLNILLRAREHCDKLIVGVVTDQALFAAKGKHPMVPLAERMQILAALGLVDEVVVDQGSKLDVWHRHNFDVLFKGDDWLGTPKGDRLVADMATVGVRVHFFPYTQSTSSTRLRGIVTSREPGDQAALNGAAPNGAVQNGVVQNAVAQTPGEE